MTTHAKPALREQGSTAALLATACSVLAASSDSAVLDAELLLAFVTGRSRSSLRAFPERAVDAGHDPRSHALVARRAAAGPLAYLAGRREFYSLDLTVAEAVLVPRPETELLVAIVLNSQPLRAEDPAILDLGTGSG